eukprot:TRINITY_DN12044_c0_g1_i1.p1 TRINITY_DN12044_c0_g1~~TRINITY_DN12044_c0_g1_i1.p1  ORF type:complete len:444 (+),score=65.66 TRINITY_DN12044_c0_g1_i1:72-1334(+)
MKRTALLTHELPISVETFFLDYWAKGEFWVKFGSGMGWSDTVAQEWTKLDGCLERKCTWVIPLAAFGVGKTTPVTQHQRARFIHDTNTLMIELSSSTPEVMFGSDFVVEQLWEITSSGENKCTLNVSSGVNWLNQPWGIGMVKGTIDEKSQDETKKSAAHFAALIGQELASPSEKKGRSPGIRRSRRTGTEDKTLRRRRGPGEENPLVVSSSTQQVPTMPNPPDQATLSSLSKLQPFMSQVWKLIQNFLSSTFLQGMCTLALLIFVYTMFSRVIVLEKQFELPQDSAYSKILFLEHFLGELTRNITGDDNLMQEQYLLWKKSFALEQELGEWSKQIEQLLKLLKNKDSSVNAVDLQRELLRRLDKADFGSQATGSSWSSWLMYWTLICGFLSFVGGLLFNWWSGRIELKMPVVFKINDAS